MPNFARLAFAVIFGLFCSSLAHASSDYGCTVKMKVFENSFTGCGSKGFLSPGNDTRINLVFLMADAHHQKLSVIPHPDQYYPVARAFQPGDWANFTLEQTPQVADNADQNTTGEGDICVSEAKGRAQFLSAVALESTIPEDEKLALTQARSVTFCTPGTGKQSVKIDLKPLPQIQSPAAKDFAAYLEATAHFYQVNREDASHFSALSNVTQPWVKEASVYMEARTLLLATQAAAFDQYGTLQRNGISLPDVKKAVSALNTYLKAYPNGAYAASATGLLRRAYWLSDDQSQQLATYAQLVAAQDVNAASLEVVNELDLRLPISAFTDPATTPMLLAVQDFRLMRSRFDDHAKPLPGMKAEFLEAQRSQFAKTPDLFDYLLAARAWFVDKDARTVLSLLTAKVSAEDMGYLEFSRQLLRAAALDTINDEDARKVYVALFPHVQSAFQRNTLELALAMSDEKHKKIGPDFDKESLITDPSIRTQLLTYVAGPIILRQQATAPDVPQSERDIARVTLLTRDLVHGRFKGYLEDVALLPAKKIKPSDSSGGSQIDVFDAFRWEGRNEGFICPDVVSIVKILVANAQDVHARLCLGDLFRLKGLGETTAGVSDYGSDNPVIDYDVLGGTGTLFSGKPLARQEIYSAIMKDKAASLDERAYALFRAVHCYEPAHSNSCGGKDVSLAQRKAWYDELKGSYGGTTWAKALRYYW